MSITGLVIAAVLIGIILLWVAFPLFKNTSKKSNRVSYQQQRDRANIYYDRILRNIRDLDEDFTTGKINPEEYHHEREIWMERGTRLLAFIDQLDANEGEMVHLEIDASEVDAVIEQMINQHHQSELEHA